MGALRAYDALREPPSVSLKVAVATLREYCGIAVSLLACLPPSSLPPAFPLHARAPRGVLGPSTRRQATGSGHRRSVGWATGPFVSCRMLRAVGPRLWAL